MPLEGFTRNIKVYYSIDTLHTLQKCVKGDFVIREAIGLA
jgi:hypothetical protein